MCYGRKPCGMDAKLPKEGCDTKLPDQQNCMFALTKAVQRELTKNINSIINHSHIHRPPSIAHQPSRSIAPCTPKRASFLQTGFEGFLGHCSFSKPAKPGSEHNRGRTAQDTRCAKKRPLQNATANQDMKLTVSVSFGFCCNAISRSLSSSRSRRVFVGSSRY
jgi:hypothetical protein